MKTIYLGLMALLCLALPSQSRAAGGPDAYGYTWITSADVGGPVYNWIDITSRPGVQTVTGLGDDNSSPNLAPIGFNFHHYWIDVTQVRIGSNGWLSFNTSASNIASCFPNIPVAGGAADNYLAALMSDLNFTGVGNPGSVRYWTNSTDSFIVSYINVPYWSVNSPGWTGSTNFQVILCGADSSIKFQYGTLTAFTNGGSCNDMEVGIENSTGTIGLQVHTDVLPPSNSVILFDYPTVPLISIRDMLPQWNANSGNYSEFVYTNVPISLQSEIRNAGNANVTTTTNLAASISDMVPSVIFTSAGNLPTMAAGDDSLFTFPGFWIPSAVGQHSYAVTTSNSQDINPLNDNMVIEYNVINPCATTTVLSHVSGNTPGGSVNWNGGANDDGVAKYFNPPMPGYTITTLQYYISSNVGNGYIATIYDDNGPNGTPGTVLFTTTVLSSSVTSGAWNTVSVSPAVTLPSGGFYVAWYQGGTNIFLGCETAGPFSRRNYEILDGGWATYRYNEIQDACIRVAIGSYNSIPVAGYTSTNTGPLAYDFTNTTAGISTSWAWDFGDGNTSTLQNPSHTYAVPGVYNACLIATSPCGADTICQQVFACQFPVASYSNSSGGLSANFTDGSTGSPTSWLWDFGDSNQSTQQNPSHTYAFDGTYNVCLIATTACGSDTMCQQITVCAPLTAAFSDSTSGLSSSFTDVTSGTATSWSWDFGDGSPVDNTQNPTHVYGTNGTYNVCLITTSLCESDTICQQVTVCAPVSAAFTAADTLDTITVTDLTTGGATSWLWDFGDGGNSTQQNPVYTYPSGGVYTVCLIASSSCASDTICQQVTIIITGMHENTNNAIAVYPNPVRDVLTLQFAEANGNNEIVVCDMTGRIVLRERSNGNRTQQLHVETLPAGVYQLQAGTTRVRFVKQ